MRPGQKNNRSRGRGNGGGGGGGRKNVNPLSRSYESNGPDVKVRGNPATIAEKYVQLARDAQASGDSVMAENYFQHAEHYFRIISAAQAQAQAQVRQQDERQRERAEQQQNNNDASGERTDEVKVEPAADNSAEPIVVAQADSKQAASSDEESAPRPRRAPRTRRPRRKPVENAELSEAPQPSINLAEAEAPKAAASNDDAPAKTGGDDSTATEAAE
ncbi:DUF4167 domain-containing protein [Maritalea sp.]|uniref:DUF4167 domain-containing protein n=1 Tax=Maritalea sp. TaxID=2003361 RepID=UPI003EF9C831